MNSNNARSKRKPRIPQYFRDTCRQWGISITDALQRFVNAVTVASFIKKMESDTSSIAGAFLRLCYLHAMNENDSKPETITCQASRLYIESIRSTIHADYPESKRKQLINEDLKKWSAFVKEYVIIEEVESIYGVCMTREFYMICDAIKTSPDKVLLLYMACVNEKELDKDPISPVIAMALSIFYKSMPGTKKRVSVKKTPGSLAA